MGLYETLGVGKNDSAEKIRKAYIKKAKQTHPDHGGSKEEFIKVQKAYLVLSDAHFKERYDKTGDENVSEADNSQQEILAIVIAAFDVIVGAADSLRKNPLTMDIAEEIRKAIKKKISEIESEKSRMEKQKGNVERFLGRFSGAEFMELALKSKIDGVSYNIKMKEKDIEKLNRALEITASMSFRIDPEEENPYTNMQSIAHIMARGY